MSKALEQITDDLYLLALDYRSAAPGDARDKWLELEAYVAGLVAEREALKAELERIRAMEPVAWRWPSEKSSVVEWRYTLDKTKPESEPLYTLEKP